MGIFLCWRVKGGTFEENESRENRRYGISIGHKDTDNLFLRNRIVGNGIAGIHFRNESEPMAGHRNQFRDNLIAGNAQYGVRVDGETHDLLFEGNEFADDGERHQKVAISIGPQAFHVVLSANRWNGQAIENEAGPHAIRISD